MNICDLLDNNSLNTHQQQPQQQLQEQQSSGNNEQPDQEAHNSTPALTPDTATAHSETQQASSISSGDAAQQTSTLESSSSSLCVSSSDEIKNGPGSEFDSNNQQPRQFDSAACNSDTAGDQQPASSSQTTVDENFSHCSSSTLDDEEKDNFQNNLMIYSASNESNTYSTTNSSRDGENVSSTSGADSNDGGGASGDASGDASGTGIISYSNAHSDLHLMSNDENQIDSIFSGSSAEEAMADDTPIEKFFKLCESPNPSNIESASKYVVPALEFANSQEEYVKIFNYLRQFCFYSDVLLRSLWLEQIQNVIQYLHQEMDNITVEFTQDFNMPYNLAVLINDLMREQAYQVKKCATASILYIIEKQLLNNSQIEQLIIPSLLNLVKENNEDFHIDCVSLFGKLAPLVGSELTSKYFLQPFCQLCSSPVFHTRKACASNIVDIANVVSIEEVESFLLNHFCEFMKDQVWAIRKVCADSFSAFASRCTRPTRENVLTDFFIRLLDDNSRWVKISAYKSLGPFIATFIRTDAEKLQLLKRRKSLLNSQTSSAGNQSESPSKEKNETAQKEKQLPTDHDINMVEVFGPQRPLVLSRSSTKATATTSTDASTATTATADTTTTTAMSEASLVDENKVDSPDEPNKKEGEYSDFMYWRNAPLSALDSGASEQTKSEQKMDESREQSQTQLDSVPKSEEMPVSSLTNLINSSSASSVESHFRQQTSLFSSSSNLFSSQFNQSIDPASCIEELTNELKQEIIPPILLSHFVTMIDVNSQNSLDSEMNYNCAYNFPAIALTLGVDYWKYIKNLYKKLAEDVSWKVRQTLAYSIHELAIILGTEHTQTDLVPIFDSYIKDVDEVRIGIVANLTKFLRVLSLECRCSYMPKLNDFLKMDNQRNWRFRNELGLQIAQFCELFPADCLADFVQPVTFTLALDKIAQVRLTALKALIAIFRQFEINNQSELRNNFIDDVMRTFANSNKWTFRQLYVILCENILKTNAYNKFDDFCRDFLPKLVSFRNEKVANIRVIVARVVSTYLMNNDFFIESTNNQFWPELELTIQQLANDRDIDVRSYFSNVKCELSVKHANDTSMDTTHDKSQFDSINNDKSNDAEPSTEKEAQSNENAATFAQQTKPSYQSQLEDDDEDDDEDEIIDQTKQINKLKIVNLDNEMDDEMEGVVESATASETATEAKSDAFVKNRDEQVAKIAEPNDDKQNQIDQTSSTSTTTCTSTSPNSSNLNNSNQSSSC